MFETMLKTMMPDFDLEQVKTQALQFAKMFAEQVAATKRIEEKQDRIIALLQPSSASTDTPHDAAQASTLHPEKEIDNGHQSLDGNSPSASWPSL